MANVCLFLNMNRKFDKNIFPRKLWQEYFHGNFDKNISTKSLTRMFSQKLSHSFSLWEKMLFCLLTQGWYKTECSNDYLPYIGLDDGQRLPIILNQQKVWQEYFQGSFDKNISTESLTRIFPRNLWQEYFHGKSDKNIFSETFPFFFTCYVFSLLNPRLEISRILKDSRHFKFFGTFFALSLSI